MSTRLPFFRAGAAAALIAVACTGCVSGTTESADRVAASEVTTSPAPTSTPSAAPVISEGAVVATGEFTSPDDSFSGRVSVVSSGGSDFVLAYEDVTTTRSGVLATSLSTQPFDPVSYCAGGSLDISYGNADLTSQPIIDFWRGDVMGQDPAFLDAVLVTQGSTPECGYTVVAVAPLTWTLPVMRPDIQPHDSGVTGGANGVAEIVDGELVSYTVGPDDLIAEVAARFGLPVDDLLYLNPFRTSDAEQILVDGETLNLSPDRR
jgi:hypothetical protein